MGEENKIFGGANRLFFAPKGTEDFVELPIVEGCLDVSYKEDEFLKATLPPLKTSFEMQFDDASEVFKRYFYKQSLERANKMLESIKEEMTKFYAANPPKNRRERRKRAKELQKRIARFKAYCKKMTSSLNFLDENLVLQKITC